MNEPLRPAALVVAGLDLAPLLASWVASDARVWVALVPFDQLQEAAEALAVAGTPWLAVASGAGCGVLCSDRPFPRGLERWVQANRVTCSSAFVREMTGMEAAGAVLFSFGAADGYELEVMAGGAWERLTTKIKAV